MLSIRALPQDVVSQLRSSFIIQSLPGCVVELVQNSLDAHATSIEVAFGVDGWQCRVTDNGDGIDKLGLADVGKRYHTSKASDVSSLESITTYGYRGEALASIADASLVEITTRHSSHRGTYSAILHGGETLYNGRSKYIERTTPGTCIHVRDLFYKWPVRRKEASLSPNYKASTAAKIRRAIEHLAVVHPAVAFSLQDLERADASLERIMSIPVHPTVVARFGSIYGKGLVKRFDDIDMHDGEYGTKGFISLVSSHTKQHQLVYINGRPISTCDIHQKINALFAHSAFARRSELESRHQENEVSPSKGFALTESPRKHLDHHPIFCLDMDIPLAKVDIGLEPTKRIVHFHEAERVLLLVSSAVEGFLMRHGFLAQDPANSALALPQSVQPLRAAADSPSKDVRRPPPYRFPPSVVADLPPMDTCCTNRSTTFHPEEVVGSEQAGKRSVPRFQRDRTFIRQGPAISSSQPLLQHVETPEWLRRTLDDWSNPVFPAASKTIKTFEAPMPSIPARYGAETGLGHLTHHMRKEEIEKLVFTEQVDRKFLLCTLPSAGGSHEMLLLLDQHAVDERVRVEALLKEYCSQVHEGRVDLMTLQESRPILLSPSEVMAVRLRIADLARWGVVVEVGASAEQITLLAVPAVVGERLMVETRLVQLLIKRYLPQLAETGPYAPRTGDRQAWTTIVRHCPELLIDLINSKACRGAIMFNDELSVEQSNRLLSQLATTDFPFICAHGRPTMVPLIKLSNQEARARGVRRIQWKGLRRHAP